MWLVPPTRALGLCRYGLTGNIEIALIMPNPREGTKVSVATEEDKPTNWTRTPEQEQIVAEHLARIARKYTGADPLLIEALTDSAIMGTPEVETELGYTRRTRVFQLYTAARDLAEIDQLPHPTAIPEIDATGGHRGTRVIRGIMRGRFVLWAFQSGRFRWDSITRTVVRQDQINHGGAPKKRS